jgi:hypothetical protein
VIAWLCWLALEAAGAVAFGRQVHAGAWWSAAPIAVCMLAVLADWCRAPRPRLRRQSGHV